MGTEDTNIESRIKELIIELLFLSDVNPEDIKDTDILEETLEVDSVALFQIVAGLEEEFEIRFGDDEFDASRFNTVKAIADIVRSMAS